MARDRALDGILHGERVMQARTSWLLAVATWLRRHRRRWRRRHLRALPGGAARPNDPAHRLARDGGPAARTLHTVRRDAGPVLPLWHKERTGGSAPGAA